MLRKVFEDIYMYLEEELTRKALELLDNKELAKISVSHADYLEVINKKGNPTLGEIAQELDFSKPSVTIMVNKLINQGFVRKVQSEEDKRVFFVELTDLGRALVDIQLNIYRDFASDLEKVLGNNEAEKLGELLSKGLKAIRK